MTHQQLQTIDADTLLSTTLPPTRFIIDRLLPQGLHILAGAPKVGKSWLALWLCLQVAQGTSVWDFPTHRGTVLYLCLEDSLTRIQSRLFQITDDAPEALHFATIAAGIGEGLEEQLTNFLTQHPDTSLVVIDTLQRIRTGSDSGNPYANDYRDISVLKALADKHHIAIASFRIPSLSLTLLCQKIAIVVEMAFSLHTSCRTGRYLRSKMRWNHMDIRQTFCFALITGTPKLLKPCMDSIAVRSSFFSLPAQQRARLCSYFLHCL